MRYSQDDLNGTARFRAMSGAFGALGGDLSSIYVNPAGSAVFLNNQMGLTLSSFNIKNNSNYFGTKTSDKENSIDLNQAGAVFVFNNRKDSDWRKISLGVNYEKTNDSEYTFHVQMDFFCRTTYCRYFFGICTCAHLLRLALSF